LRNQVKVAQLFVTFSLEIKLTDSRWVSFKPATTSEHQ